MVLVECLSNHTKRHLSKTKTERRQKKEAKWKKDGENIHFYCHWHRHRHRKRENHINNFIFGHWKIQSFIVNKSIKMRKRDIKLVSIRLINGILNDCITKMKLKIKIKKRQKQNCQYMHKFCCSRCHLPLNWKQRIIMMQCNHFKVYIVRCTLFVWKWRVSMHVSMPVCACFVLEISR